MEFAGSEAKQPLAPKSFVQPPSPSSSHAPRQLDLTSSHSSGKVPVVRGARACSVCRVAKMKCVGAEDGATPCQRCKRTGQECIFEKHKRGRKPGSKLSEASKMLRKLEKGLHNAKAKSHTGSGQSVLDSRGGGSVKAELDPAYDGKLSNGLDYRDQGQSPPEDSSSDGGDNKRVFPSKIIREETHRNSFFNTILNPQHENPTTQLRTLRSPPTAGNTDTTVEDVITLGIITEAEANKFFDLVFLRLNPFINLFDPILHTAVYVRSKSRFLFTTLMMAICKFFEPKKHKQCYELANDMATKAFAYGWKSVEVVQAFACLTYYRDADEARTWTLIGFACRMAVELDLNRYCARPPERETPLQRLERRNRERTYLVLFIHDRSLSTQTGRSWMLPECELVRNAMNWHEQGGSDAVRPEDVIVASFVQLRRIAAEATELFATPQSGNYSGFNYDLLHNCNTKLSQWTRHWEHELIQANADRFHISFINVFRLYIRLFLNSFGLQAAMSSTSANRVPPSTETLTTCYQSALEMLEIIFTDMTSMGMLCYSQDSITIMSAYAAIFLLRLLRSPITLHETATEEFHLHITKAADAYAEAASISPAVTSLYYHARFLRALVINDQERRSRDSSVPSNSTRQEEPNPAPHEYQSGYASPASSATFSNSSHLQYSGQSQPLYDYTLMNGHLSPAITAVPLHASTADQQYWRSMFGQLGYPSDITEPGRAPSLANGAAGYMSYGDSQRFQHQSIYGHPPVPY